MSAASLAKDIDGPATSVLRAPVPLDVDLELNAADGIVSLTDAEGVLVGRGETADRDLLPTPPEPPAWRRPRRRGSATSAWVQRVHPTCFSCGPERHEGDGLRVFAGQIDGEPDGHLACVWTPHTAFADAEGMVPSEVIWAALDCPGVFAWIAKEGRHGALLGTMTGEVLRRPKAGEACIVTAWPLAREGRKETAGVALFSADGELLARAHQVWIMMGPRPQPQATAPEAVSA